MAMIILSVIVLCVESEHYFTMVPINASIDSTNSTIVYQKEIIPGKRVKTEANLYSLFIIESLAMTWFTVEFFVRPVVPSNLFMKQNAVFMVDFFLVFNLVTIGILKKNI